MLLFSGSIWVLDLVFKATTLEGRDWGGETIIPRITFTFFRNQEKYLLSTKGFDISMELNEKSLIQCCQENIHQIIRIPFA
jgi:hypothetical protein